MDVQDSIDPDSDPDSTDQVSIKRKHTPWITYIAGFISLSSLALICLASIGLGLAYTQRGTWLLNLATLLVLDGPAKNQIAFVGNDHNIWIVSPDGNNLRWITTDSRGYAFPAWSPDGRYVAFMGRDSARHVALYFSPALHAAPNILYSTPQSSPFYFYWAPTSQAITFLAQEEDNLSMYLVDINQPQADYLLGEGSPFYWVWSPSGDKLLIHVGGARTASEEAHLSILNDPTSSKRIELKVPPGQFQAPLWSPDGAYIYYVVSRQGNEQTIYKADEATLTQTPLVNITGDSPLYLVTSPDNHYLAYLESRPQQGFPLGKAYLVNTDNGDTHPLTEHLALSMYWSPDGRKVALLILATGEEAPAVKAPGWATQQPQNLRFQWWVYNVDTDTLEFLTDFTPTPEFFQVIPYFDQYHHSLRLWSPDSRYLVTTTRAEETDDGLVLVIDTTKADPPKIIGEGTLAVWSWQ